jgi:hypothetical protein
MHIAQRDDIRRMNILCKAFVVTKCDKNFLAISRIISKQESSVLSLMTEAEMVSETLNCFSELTNLVAREYFIQNINVLNIILSLMGMQ